MKRAPSVLDGALLVGGVTALSATLAVGVLDALQPMFNDWPAGAALTLGFGLWAIIRRLRNRGAPGRPASVCWMLASALWMLSSRDNLGPLPQRVVVLGIDGATWSVIDHEPLPGFARAQREGARGDLVSMEPMFSPLLWTTMASGKKPDEHGIRGFHVHADDCKVARWWDIAEANGQGVGLYKWLVDYPPRSFKTGGFWVPSWLAPGPETWPAKLAVVKEIELANRLRRKQVGQGNLSIGTAKRLFDVGVRLSTFAHAAAWVVEERLFRPSEVRRNVAMQLIRGSVDRDVFIAQLYAAKPDVASFNYYATDGLAHLYWSHFQAGGPELRAAYRQADDILTELLTRRGSQTRVVLVSDHGFQAMDTKGQAGQFLPLTERLRVRLSQAVAPVDVTRIGHKLVVGTASAAQAQRVAAYLPILTDELGAAFYRVETFPDDPGSLALTVANEMVTAERLAHGTVGSEPIADYLKPTEAYTGTHHARGVILLVGDGITAGTALGEVALLDVAPTILAAAGLPVGLDLVGRAQGWTELPRVVSWDSLVPGLVFLDGDEGSNQEMLESLGYIDDGKQ